MNRLLYENSVAYQGHLIIPFLYSNIDGQNFYSYHLLSELGCKGKLHKAENPAGIYASSINDIIDIAKAHLEENSDIPQTWEIFKERYTCRHNLIIIYRMNNRFFYERYPPEELRNIADLKLFESQVECRKWIEEELDREK